MGQSKARKAKKDDADFFVIFYIFGKKEKEEKSQRKGRKRRDEGRGKSEGRPKKKLQGVKDGTNKVFLSYLPSFLFQWCAKRKGEGEVMRLGCVCVSVYLF